MPLFVDLQDDLVLHVPKMSKRKVILSDDSDNHLSDDMEEDIDSDVSVAVVEH